MRHLASVIPLALLALGCSKLVADARADEGGPHTAASASAAPAAKSAAPAKAAAPESDSSADRYGIPFAWEVEKDEPLAKARAYLGDVLTDNAANIQLGKEHFLPLAEKQAPRATVVTCSDSRVQSSAWDATPENDAFTIRNIGNQVSNAYGSVEYGLEHLNTPVLIVLGHTGCGAVKATMGKLDELDAPIKAELSGIKLPEPNPKANERRAWADAVVANVNNQVAFAVGHFGKLLREQRVLVVGAVYDFRNDLGRGYGRISIVNVNGNTEAKRLRAFELALGTPIPSNAEPSASDATRDPREAAADSTLAAMLRRQALAAHAHEAEPAHVQPKVDARAGAHAEPDEEPHGVRAPD